ncbi:bifunctional phosphoribosyl-AMP cyclohydrolase/phosphoribosyl-ATP diphosphatase HisIE [Buchnera aphidicola]|uniref:Histidine biosynthesis bifunctional protein HisIE n=1 Tax=Buchnera aphidicola subsp. Cinara cedri (strain Cc) TaxID=372461 RepID=Q058A1_BUCCC|nr:bifunctional phosphoribosyl-AMP cyclohydrolase/phosphoribosyl-ATP diphosphatase HisIE [Buchnera aphidicola]ABJ90548.1 phosphoribosyl-AMP cyclohydrolase / phosphoribosyl-ATP pyrophosphohydrolase [Buchnera aphidicola BCc]
MLIDQNLQNLNWTKNNGLIPAIAQHYISGEILMFGYMNQKAFDKMISNKLFTLYSRKKKRIWIKGETSKNFLYVKNISTDCDTDVILVKVNPAGNTCHLNRFSCFESSHQLPYTFLYKLENRIRNKKENFSRSSYVSNLFSSGNNRIAQKIGEESVEVIIAFLENNHVNIINETSDLIFHLFILLQSMNINLYKIIKNLQKRVKK